MSDTDSAREEQGGDTTRDESTEMVQCKACGTKFVGVNGEECKRWMAGHVLDEHEDEAPEPVLEQARERLEAMAE